MSENINSELRKQDGNINDLIKKNEDTLKISDKSHRIIHSISERIRTNICQRIILKIAFLALFFFWIMFYLLY